MVRMDPNPDQEPDFGAPQLETSLTGIFTFEASHQLEWHSGKCSRLHGHSYQLSVTVTGPVNGDGIVIDFAVLKAAVQAHVLDDYDHAHLNDLLSNPTAELIAADAATRLLAAGLPVSEVTIRETAKYSSTVRIARR